MWSHDSLYLVAALVVTIIQASLDCVVVIRRTEGVQTQIRRWIWNLWRRGDKVHFFQSHLYSFGKIWSWPLNPKRSPYFTKHTATYRSTTIIVEWGYKQIRVHCIQIPLETFTLQPFPKVCPTRGVPRISCFTPRAVPVVDLLVVIHPYLNRCVYKGAKFGQMCLWRSK